MKARLVLQHFGIDSESAELIFNFLSVDWVHQHKNLRLELLEEIRRNDPLSCPRQVPALFGRIDIDRVRNRVGDLNILRKPTALAPPPQITARRPSACHCAMRNSHDWRRFCTCSENLSTAADRLDRSSIIGVALFALSAILASSDRNCVPYVSSSRSTTNPHRRANAAIDSLLK